MERARSHDADGAAAAGETAASAREALLRLALGDRLLESVHKAHVLVVGAGGTSASSTAKCSCYHPREDVARLSLVESSHLQHRCLAVPRALLCCPVASLLSLR